MAEISVSIVHPIDVQQWLYSQQRKRGGKVATFALLLESVELWTIDQVRTDADGTPTGVNDERGTAEDRLHALMRLQHLINSQEFADYLRKHAGSSESTEVDRLLIDVLSIVKASRFLVCLNHMSTIAPQFVNRWLDQVSSWADAGDVMAHVIRERVVMLNRAGLIKTVFSREAVEKVRQVIERISHENAS